MRRIKAFVATLALASVCWAAPPWQETAIAGIIARIDETTTARDIYVGLEVQFKNISDKSMTFKYAMLCKKSIEFGPNDNPRRVPERWESKYFIESLDAGSTGERITLESESMRADCYVLTKKA